jgi:hypothetical protein
MCRVANFPSLETCCSSPSRGFYLLRQLNFIVQPRTTNNMLSEEAVAICKLLHNRNPSNWGCACQDLIGCKHIIANPVHSRAIDNAPAQGARNANHSAEMLAANTGYLHKASASHGSILRFCLAYFAYAYAYAEPHHKLSQIANDPRVLVSTAGHKVLLQLCGV